MNKLRLAMMIFAGFILVNCSPTAKVTTDKDSPNGKLPKTVYVASFGEQYSELTFDGISKIMSDSLTASGFKVKGKQSGNIKNTDEMIPKIKKWFPNLTDDDAVFIASYSSVSLGVGTSSSMDVDLKLVKAGKVIWSGSDYSVMNFYRSKKSKYTLARKIVLKTLREFRAKGMM